MHPYRCVDGFDLHPLSNRPPRSGRGSTLKSFRLNPRLIATSQKLAALKSSLLGLSIKDRACLESHRGAPAAQSRRWVPVAVSCTTAYPSISSSSTRSASAPFESDQGARQAGIQYDLAKGLMLISVTSALRGRSKAFNTTDAMSSACTKS